MYKSGFTVLISVYAKDDAAFFHRALQSIFSNTLKPDKVLLIIDGPLSSEIEDVLMQFSEEQTLSIVRSPTNKGLSSALNIGLENIDTEFTIRADSDDFNYRNRFETLIYHLGNGYDLVGSSILEVDKLGRKLSIRQLPLDYCDIVNFAKKRNPFNHMSVGFRTQVVVDAGGYPNIYLKEDYALWATLISKGVKMCNCREILVDATTGQDFYKRRGGLRYAISEIAIQKHLVSTGIKKPYAAFLDGLFRSIIFIAPGRLRELIYLNFLRRKVE